MADVTTQQILEEWGLGSLIDTFQGKFYSCYLIFQIVKTHWKLISLLLSKQTPYFLVKLNVVYKINIFKV